MSRFISYELKRHDVKQSRQQIHGSARSSFNYSRKSKIFLLDCLINSLRCNFVSQFSCWKSISLLKTTVSLVFYTPFKPIVFGSLAFFRLPCVFTRKICSIKMKTWFNLSLKFSSDYTTTLSCLSTTVFVAARCKKID